jgi:hypothetical protein
MVLTRDRIEPSFIDSSLNSVRIYFLKSGLSTGIGKNVFLECSAMVSNSMTNEFYTK